MAKKINAKLKRAYYYFDFEKVVHYEEVKERIEHLKRIPTDEFVFIKVSEYADEIEEYFEDEKRVQQTKFPVAFTKEEPRESWEHYTDDFPENIFNVKIKISLKTINTKLKRAYYYFGFDEVVPYKKVKKNIECLEENAHFIDVLIKIDKYSNYIEEYFNTYEKRRLDDDFFAKFSKNEPKKSWEHYTDDFPEDIFITELKAIEEKSIEDEGFIEPIMDDEIELDVHEGIIDEVTKSEYVPVNEESNYNKTKIFLNDELLGYTENPISFTEKMREKRRLGKVSNQMNITFYEDTNEIYIFNDPGRARRPLIIVKKGKPLLMEYHLRSISNGNLQWDDLIARGVIEFLDAGEEENSYIAMDLEDLNEEHTHLEIDPTIMLGICAGTIPFLNHNSYQINTTEVDLTKQAIGLLHSNYTYRNDEIAHLLHHPQTPIVKTRVIDSSNYDLRPSGQNFVVALMSYEGYNMKDGMIINKASLERGLGRSSFFRSYCASERRYAGGQKDKFEFPDKNIEGYRSEEVYRNLDKEGVVIPESYVESGDVLISKTSPPRFLDENFQSGGTEKRRETSITVRHGEKGIVDAVILSETISGSRQAKIRVRDTRQPEFGDKFASKHGQKGVVGLILSPEDVPFTEFGVVPDLIVNPHAIPSKMSIGQVLEMVAGKAGCLEGKRVDATPFNKNTENEVRQQLIYNGFESAGCESLYNGVTGERIDAEIFIGVTYYQKLNHMVSDKIQARSRGPIQVLTHQPTEGRMLDGGLRFGEMERDCLVSHGAALTLKERLLDESDKYEAIVCENCGMLGVFDRNRNRIYCPLCGDVETYPVEISYAFKLFLDELKSLCIFPKLKLGDKTEFKKPLKKKSSFKPKPLEDNTTLITKTPLSEQEPSQLENESNEKLENCMICGKKLNKYQKKVCKTCARKQYASRIIKILSDVVKPGVPFAEKDLKPLKLVDLQIKDYIWTLQEFDLIDVDNYKFTLKNEETLNNFRLQYGFDAIDFDSIEGLDKTCKTCGKTLSLSKFYKTSDGYEDNCKDCKRLINTASYLNDIVVFIGFDKEFTENDLKRYISNSNQLMGMIWALQDQDLLNETEFSTYILADKSQCLNFMDKYLDKSKLETKYLQKTEENIVKPNKIKSEKKFVEKNMSISNDENMSKIQIKSKSKNNVKSKPKVRGDLGKSNILFPANINDIKPKHDSKLVNEKKELMNVILNARKEGKTREEAAEIAGIPLHRINHWYREGRQGFGKENIEFYKQLKEIENDLFDSSDSNERKHMEFVLKLLRKGKSKKEVAKFTNLNESTLTSWYNQGREKRNLNTIYFYNEVQKINSIKTENILSIETDKTHKSKSENKITDSFSQDYKKEIENNKIKAKELKIKIKEFIPKFVELDEKIVHTNAKSKDIKSIRKEIKSNIKILKQSSRLRRIDRLENRLSNAEKSYDALKTKINNYPKYNYHTKDQKDKLIKKNVKTIINLRKKFKNTPPVLNELSEISFLNSKLNTKLKNRKNVNYAEILKIKERLDNIKYNPLDSSTSKNIKSPDNIQNRNVVKTTNDELNKLKDSSKLNIKPVNNIQKDNVVKTTNDELNKLKDSSKLNIKPVNNIQKDNIVKNSNEYFKKSIKHKKHHDENKILLNFLYFITGSNDNSPKVSYLYYLTSNNLSAEDGIKIKNTLKNEIFEGKLETSDDIKMRLDELINQKQLEKKEKLLKVLYSITGSEDISLKDSFISYLNSNNLSVKHGIIIRDILKEEITNEILESSDDVKLRLKELIKQKNFLNKDELLEVLYSITGNSLSLKSSYTSYINSKNLSRIVANEIKDLLENEIIDGFLKSPDEINLRLEELIKQKKLENINLLIEYLDSAVKDDELTCNLNNNDLNVIMNKIIEQINAFELNYKMEVYSSLINLIEEKESDNIKVLIESLDSVVEANEFKFSEYNLNDDDISIIRNKLIKEIKSFELKSENRIYSRFNELVEKYKKEKFNNLLEYSYEIMGENNISDSFLEKLSNEGLGLNNGIYIREVVEEKIKADSINSKIELNNEISNLINEEVKRQNRSLNKLDEIYNNDNIYLIGFSSDDKNKIKDIVIKSIKENRLNYLSVYFEFKKTVKEFNKLNAAESNNNLKVEAGSENNEKKSSRGLISRLKGIFSSKK